MTNFDEFDEVPLKQKPNFCQCCEGRNKELDGFKVFSLIDAEGVAYLSSYVTKERVVIVPWGHEVLPPEALESEDDGNLWEQFAQYLILITGFRLLKGIPRRKMLDLMSAARRAFRGRLQNPDKTECDLGDIDEIFGTCDCEEIDCGCCDFDGKYFDMIRQVDEHGMPLHISENRARLRWIACFMLLTHPELIEGFLYNKYQS